MLPTSVKILQTPFLSCLNSKAVDGSKDSVILENISSNFMTVYSSSAIANEVNPFSLTTRKMLLTRLGDGSKMVVTGDIQQADRKEADNGLLDFRRLVSDYQNCKYVAGIEFGGKDIQRHPAVLEILKIYKEI